MINTFLLTGEGLGGKHNFAALREIALQLTEFRATHQQKAEEKINFMTVIAKEASHRLDDWDRETEISVEVIHPRRDDQVSLKGYSGFKNLSSKLSFFGFNIMFDHKRVQFPNIGSLAHS